MFNKIRALIMSNCFEKKKKNLIADQQLKFREHLNVGYFRIHNCSRQLSLVRRN